MDLGLNNKIALVTAASQGLGKASALSIANEGATVIICSRDKEKISKAAKDIKDQSGSEVIFFQTDLSEEIEINKMVEDIIKKYGRIDILVNNTGGPKAGFFDDITDNDWLSTFESTFLSAVRLTRSVLPSMKRNKWGRIINISSVVGVKGNAGQSNYSASKAGIIGFSKSIALELGSRNIRSNVIAPGFIETDMTDSLSEDIIKSWKESIPLKRGGDPNDVGNACVFLASDLSSYITGQVLQVDGGLLT